MIIVTFNTDCYFSDALDPNLNNPVGNQQYRCENGAFPLQIRSKTASFTSRFGSVLELFKANYLEA